MRIFIILLIASLTGCAPLRFSPAGQMGLATPYYHSFNQKFTCVWCGEETNMYKVDNKGRVICRQDFEKLYK